VPGASRRAPDRAGGAAAQADAPPGGATGPLKSRLAKIGLVRDWDYVLHLPLRYEDETSITPIAALVPGVEAQVEGEVLSAEVVARGRRQLSATLRDASGLVQLRFLHFYPSQVKQLAVGRRVRAYGAMRAGYSGSEMVHPRVRAADEQRPLPAALTPVYPAGEGIAQPWLRKRIARALLDVQIADLVPPAWRERLGLPELRTALERLHRPPPGADQTALGERSDPAWRRLKFDELLAQQIALRGSRLARAGAAAPVLKAQAGGLVERVFAALPFELTGAQQRVWGEVEADLACAQAMHRLVQGDVGSGKTVIAALAAARAIEAGHQAALMAPTEILAEQHFRKVAQWLEPLGVRIAWLAGKLKPAEKAAAQARLAAGEVDLAVGTHALIQDAVRFARLGLAIVDEQHRFGVAQRLALRAGEGAAGDGAAHLLTLSATPIPRTLAMSYLADLDVSVIDELPPGRQPVRTKLVAVRRKDEVMASIRAEVAQGRQVYWVCPLIEASDELELTAATETHGQIVAALPELRVGLLHGQMAAAEKAATMAAFVAGALEVLVATTVIEVGVDVPNATLMVIEHAERFGLAQLHQLRGRVGRGAEASFCILLFDEPLSEAARARLKVIYETADGFEVARRDLELRGPGEFLGARQSGQPLLRFADLIEDAEIVVHARELAERWLREDPAAAREHARRWFEGRQDFLAA
jgi:ATP-dependent DNA helicase RecG